MSCWSIDNLRSAATCRRLWITLSSSCRATFGDSQGTTAFELFARVVFWIRSGGVLVDSVLEFLSLEEREDEFMAVETPPSLLG